MSRPLNLGMRLGMALLVEMRHIMVEAAGEAPRTRPRRTRRAGLRTALGLVGVRRLARGVGAFVGVLAPAAAAIEGGRGPAKGGAALAQAGGGAAARRRRGRGVAAVGMRGGALL